MAFTSRPPVALAALALAGAILFPAVPSLFSSTTVAQASSSLLFEENFTSDNSTTGKTAPTQAQVAARGWKDGVSYIGTGYLFETDSTLNKNVMYAHWTDATGARTEPDGVASGWKKFFPGSSDVTMYALVKFHNVAGSPQGAHWVRFFNNPSAGDFSPGNMSGQMDLDVSGNDQNSWLIDATTKQGLTEVVNGQQQQRGFFLYSGGALSFGTQGKSNTWTDDIWYEVVWYLKANSSTNSTPTTTSDGQMRVFVRPYGTSPWTTAFDGQNFVNSQMTANINMWMIGPYMERWTTDIRHYYSRVVVWSGDAFSNGTVASFLGNTPPPPPTNGPAISSVSASGMTTSSATVSWNTDQASDSQVNYGTTTSYGSSTTLNASMVTSHSQSLSGLSAGTTYHYRVNSRNAGGQLTTSGDFTFATAANPAPAISSVASSGVTGSAATITWTTNQSADSQVNYGTTTSYGSSTTLDGTMVTSHSQSLSGLNAGTTYHYRVTSKNATGQSGTSGDFTFTTIGPPAISSIVVANITGTSIQASWITNQVADSQVEYGTTTAYGSTTTLDTTLVTAHSVMVSGLTQNTTYHFRVRSTNSSGLLGTSSDGTFVATIPPVISAVASSSITGSGATITWATDQASDSQIDYGTTASYGSSTTLDSSDVTSHSQAITGLAQGTTYHYRVKSRNPQNALATSGDFTFQTASPATISSVASSNIGSATATVTWTTNQSTDSQIDYGTTTSYGSSTTLDGTMVTSHSQDLSGLNPGTTYNYRVKSRNAGGVLATSGNFTFTTVGPPAITSVSATAITGTSTTIIWTTNQTSDTQIDYGTTTNYGASTTLNTSMLTSHSQALSGLTSGTLYHFRVKSRNSLNLLTTSGDFTFTTVAPPTISAVTVSSITSTSSTITWTTNQTSDSQVDWGTTVAYGSTSTLDTLMVTSHGRALSGLAANTLYHYRVKSKNSVGLLTTSGDFTFTTIDTNTNLTLSVSKSGNGNGSIVGPLAGISCNGNNGNGNGAGSCSGSVKKGTTVTLTAMPGAGSEFSGWSGACTGLGTNCTVTVNAAASVTARFDVGTAGDFDGDGYPDLPVQNIDGSLALWLMNGSTRLSAPAVTPMVTASGIDWQIINPGSPDDPTAGPGGSTGFQKPVGGQLSAVYLTTDSRILDTRWQIGGTPDLDGNGRADLLWQNTATGQLAAWIMDGPVKTQGRFLSPSTIDPSWTMKGTGDFDGDGKPDILFQQAGTGALLCWLMDGTTKIGEHTLLPGNVPTNWTMVGTADFNNDGQTDIVWQNTQTGDVYVWYMNGTSMISENPVGRFGDGWSVRAVGDFDNDGHADLIWQKSTGELAVWFMNGLIQTKVTFLTPGSIDPSWTIMGPR